MSEEVKYIAKIHVKSRAALMWALKLIKLIEWHFNQSKLFFNSISLIFFAEGKGDKTDKDVDDEDIEIVPDAR